MVNKKCTIFTDRTPYHKTPLKYYFTNSNISDRFILTSIRSNIIANNANIITYPLSFI